MFVIVNITTEFFIKLEYSIIQSFAIMHPYKWVIADVLSKKNAIFSIVDSSYNEL